MRTDAFVDSWKRANHTIRPPSSSTPVLSGQMRSFPRASVLRPEPPTAGAVAGGGVGDADTGQADEWKRDAVIFQPQATGMDEVLAVQVARDTERPRKFSGAIEPLDATNQHGLREIHRAGHDVQHLVHPVAEINVSAAANLVHHGVSFRLAAVCVAGGVAFAEIR